MKIKFINPNSLKFGKEEHVKNLVGECLIAQGEAEEVKYGSFVEMMNDAPGRKPPVDPSVFEWGLFTRRSGAQQIFRKQVASGEMAFFKTPPNDCPRALAEKFLALTKNDPNQETYESWKARVELERYEQGKRERTAMRLAGLGKYLMGDWTKP